MQFLTARASKLCFLVGIRGPAWPSLLGHLLSFDQLCFMPCSHSPCCHIFLPFFSFHVDPFIGTILSFTGLTPVVFNSGLLSSWKLQLPPMPSSLPGYLSLFWAPITLSSSLIVYFLPYIPFSSSATKL